MPWLAAAACLLWLYSLRSNIVSHVDILWPLLHLMACVSMFISSESVTLRGSLLILVVTAWSVRLATYLAARAAGRGEDRRYAEIRARYGATFRYSSLVIIFLMQALLALIISAVFYPIITSQLPWRALDTLLLCATVVGLLYETIADQQLSAFLRRQSDTGQHQTQVLRTGLWRYSRHPNYFGEWIFWLSLALLAVSLGSWIGVVTVGLVSWLLLRFTGVARMERRTPSLRPDYLDYQRETPAFFPTFLWPRRWLKTVTKPSAQQLLLVLVGVTTLLPVQFPMAAPSSTSPAFEHWYFTAYIDDKEVGYHQFEVRRDGASTFLNGRADFEYRLWKVPLFSYFHEVSETYDRNLCLQEITSTTITRTDRVALHGRKTDAGFTLDGAANVPILEDCLTTFAYWTKEFLARDTLLNGQDGTLVPVQFSNLASENPDSAERVRLQADSLDLTLTYSNDGHWQGLESQLPAGRKLVYKLTSYRSEAPLEDLVEDQPLPQTTSIFD
ncbi:MAG: DUF1295 domain-containing protein [Gammaproteobacteria bacterium TMED92]|nr:MAG: DUF1295 domain-containing protein [Gammaproteobacteria bacterium TMED92]